MQDPTTKEPQPPFPEQAQKVPGFEQAMQPKADHGEKSYKGNGRLLGKAALITGADSGIGRAVALAYAREGADVLISYLPEEEEDARESERLVKEAGRKAVLFPGDVGCEKHCQTMVEKALQEFGRLDVLVNNAAYQRTFQEFEEITGEEFERTFRTNLFSMFHLCRAAVPHMKPGASIINTASIEAFTPKPILLPYSSTKGAIVTFTKALAGLLAKRGIRVNAVAPGPIWTPLIPHSMPQEEIQNFGRSTPLQRPGQPAELAPIFVLLASEEGSYMSAGVYEVTGGRPLT
jgi:NAD(P)-dependent dehydrogenase (short-subunit alcohol dehydrogenase family)